VINVLFARAFHGEALLARMYGRLGWIASITAVSTQVFLVPRLLRTKRVALLIPPVVMATAALGVAVLPIAATAFLLGASDRGLNYSVQQSVKETLYVPLDDAQKYKAKAFIDMFVDRAAKAAGALVLIAMIARVGTSVRASLAIALVALVGWLAAARALGRRWRAGAAARGG
jgi:AAA family ATP:ADP antiporter